jgi:hypothetical protein
MRKYILILFVFFSINIVGQIKPDTVRVSDFCIMLVFPEEYIKKEMLYEEGVFYDYIIPQDSSIITIHLGSMVSLPLIEKKDIISSRQISNMLKEECGKYIENGIVKFCRELNIYPYHLNISYDKVNLRLKKKYDDIFDNIKISFEESIGDSP